MKTLPIWREMKKFPRVFNPIILHTGQHYDTNMSDLFFRDLGLPDPNIYLGVGSGTHAFQTAKIMTEFEAILIKEKPALVIVVGDVNSTLACSIVASKSSIQIAHVESGLRSFDRAMPEEINRIVTDHLSDFLFTTCRDANENLEKEGIPKEKFFFVGNVMVDTLIRLRSKIEQAKILKQLGLEKKDYAVLTLHRPSNVDDGKVLRTIFGALKAISNHITIIFPAHPRTIKQIRNFGLDSSVKNMRIIEPLGYRNFLKLCMNCKFVMTDSGGIQEETTYTNIPCLTLRKNTERPITIKEGTNILVGPHEDKIIVEGLKILRGKHKRGRIPKLWDGKTAQRIVEVLKERI